MNSARSPYNKCRDYNIVIIAANITITEGTENVASLRLWKFTSVAG